MRTFVTPFDRFMASVQTWIDDSWYMLAAVAAMVVVAGAVYAIAKGRERARSRVPQYRRANGSYSK